MDIVLMILYVSILLGFLVLIHEGGHYLASRAFGVRVTEFMIGFPGPGIGFTKWGTKFGVTCVPLGGYAKVCGMEPGEMSPHLESVLAAIYRRGTANMEDIAQDCGISNDDALAALDELVEWGSIQGPTKKDKFNTYRAMATRPTKGQIKRAEAAGQPAPLAYELGQPRLVDDSHALFESEYSQQYRSLPFWKRTVILLAGIVVNLLFAVLVFVVVYSIVGVDMTNSQTGEVSHITMSPLRSVEVGFAYIGAVVQMVVSLFNPQTAADVVSNSTSVVGIAVMSKTYAEAGLLEFVFFMAMLSVSLGIMNLLPIPPLDGGRFVIEIFQKLTRKNVSTRALSYMSAAGMILFLGFFAIMVNQDVQRFVFGNWG